MTIGRYGRCGRDRCQLTYIVRHALGDSSRRFRDPLRWPLERNGEVGVDEKRRTRLMVIVSKCFVAKSVPSSCRLQCGISKIIIRLQNPLMALELFEVCITPPLLISLMRRGHETLVASSHFVALFWTTTIVSGFLSAVSHFQPWGRFHSFTSTSHSRPLANPRSRPSIHTNLSAVDFCEIPRCSVHLAQWFSSSLLFTSVLDLLFQRR